MSKEMIDELRLVLEKEIEKYYNPRQKHRTLKEIWEEDFKRLMVYSTLRNKVIELFPDDYDFIPCDYFFKKCSF